MDIHKIDIYYILMGVGDGMQHPGVDLSQEPVDPGKRGGGNWGIGVWP